MLKKIGACLLIPIGAAASVVIWHVIRMLRPVNMYRVFKKVYINKESIYD